ncbi:putative GDSL-like Lipase-3 [Elsinoe australis]|uniref:Putative GDSL-like Lipase-3 n=1 Tax=Elsinoe australis TaxID=40998 RepID=A0A4U7ARL6_9PEZI|nr:putative GDSL-like Lipase-3 [Elsinoe australis]
MYFPLSLLTLLTTSTLTTALPSQAKGTKPPAFFLAGDSTTATQSPGGGGWGDGFLNTTLSHNATGRNYGHNGATTVSFRSGGDWALVLAAARAALPSASPYVTIQFGHNDQKPEKNISIAAFTANLVKMVEEVRAVPAVPILVTSLSRRSYKNDTAGSPKIVENLADVVGGTKDAAEKSGAGIIDLNAASEKYLNAIGPDNAHTYNLNPTDNTHLNVQGSVVFGNMVAGLLVGEVPKLGTWVREVKEIKAAIEAGRYYWPKV